LIGKSVKDNGIEKKIYTKEEKPVLISLSKSYSKLNAILVSASSTFLVYFTLSTKYLLTNYCPKEI